VAVSQRRVALSMSFENALGVQAPVGFFDPLGTLNYRQNIFSDFDLTPRFKQENQPRNL